MNLKPACRILCLAATVAVLPHTLSPLYAQEEQPEQVSLDTLLIEYRQLLEDRARFEAVIADPNASPSDRNDAVQRLGTLQPAIRHFEAELARQGAPIVRANPGETVTAGEQATGGQTRIPAQRTCPKADASSPPAAPTTDLPRLAQASSQTATGAVDRWLREVASIESDGVAERLLGQLQRDGFSLSGDRRAGLKGLIKKNILAQLQASSRSEGMDEIVSKIAQAMEPKGNRQLRAALQQAYAVTSDLSYSRVVTGAFNTWLDVFSSTLTGGAGTARKLVEMTGTSLALDWVERLLKKTSELEQSMRESGSLPEIYRSSHSLSNGCSAELAVFWNKSAGTFQFGIFGDCQCNEVQSVNLGRWRVSGLGLARWRDGRHSQVSVRTSPAPQRGVLVDAHRCAEARETVRYTCEQDPWLVR